MLVVREFEFFESENCIVVFPCEGLGATQGEDLQDAIEFAADWLYWTVIYDMINEKPIEKFELGHEPQHGGIVIPVAVDCSLSPAEYTKFVQDFYDARMRELAAEEDISVVKKSKTPRKKNQSFRQAPVDAVKQELESPQVSLA